MLDGPAMRAMFETAFMVAMVGDAEAMLIAFDQDAAYRSVNFLWFQCRLKRFVYVDRVITSPAVRGRGHARRLYDGLFARALEAGHDRITCEINLLPPNPVSDRFHAALGFAEFGRAGSHDGTKRVRYLAKMLKSRG